MKCKYSTFNKIAIKLFNLSEDNIITRGKLQFCVLQIIRTGLHSDGAGGIAARGQIYMGAPIGVVFVQPRAPRLVKQRPCYVLSCLWDDVYKRTLAANRK